MATRPFFGHFFGDLHELDAPFLAQFREIQPDTFAVNGRVHTEVGFLQRFFNRMKHRRIPRLDDERAEFRRGDAGQLADAHLRAIGVHHHVLDQRGGGFAGAHAGELVQHHLLGLVHLVFRFQENVVECHTGSDSNQNGPACIA